MDKLMQLLSEGKYYEFTKELLKLPKHLDKALCLWCRDVLKDNEGGVCKTCKGLEGKL